ncbi:MAG: retroviral-like aspartic protease family protein [Prevotellaceae bacterium]|nr:retroviral-like aspartic protease family protein [Prevotellaceae bacterium]
MKKIFCILVLVALTAFSFNACRHRPSGPDDNKTPDRPRGGARGKCVVKMEKEGGVYHVPCKINGMEMKFIFDTGASDITISLVEAMYLFKQGKLGVEDFIGIQEYQIADGSISEGTLIRLHTVEICSKKLTDVRASIVHSTQAPLLLGQSALAKFGKISLDYKKNEITFE